jgi:hypothetical protein
MRVAAAVFLAAVWASPASSTCVDTLPCKDGAGTIFVYGSPYNPALESPQNVIEVETSQKRLMKDFATSAQSVWNDKCLANALLAFQEKRAFLAREKLAPPTFNCTVFRFGAATKF